MRGGVKRRKKSVGPSYQTKNETPTCELLEWTCALLSGLIHPGVNEEEEEEEDWDVRLCPPSL